MIPKAIRMVSPDVALSLFADADLPKTNLSAMDRMGATDSAPNAKLAIYLLPKLAFKPAREEVEALRRVCLEKLRLSKQTR